MPVELPSLAELYEAMPFVMVILTIVSIGVAAGWFGRGHAEKKVESLKEETIKVLKDWLDELRRK